jgi:hypothetical protein
MDPAENCLIKLSYTIRRQEDDTLAIFQLVEKDRDKFVAGYVLVRTSLKVDVGFI